MIEQEYDDEDGNHEDYEYEGRRRFDEDDFEQ